MSSSGGGSDEKTPSTTHPSSHTLSSMGFYSDRGVSSSVRERTPVRFARSDSGSSSLGVSGTAEAGGEEERSATPERPGTSSSRSRSPSRVGFASDSHREGSPSSTTRTAPTSRAQSGSHLRAASRSDIEHAELSETEAASTEPSQAGDQQETAYVSFSVSVEPAAAAPVPVAAPVVEAAAVTPATPSVLLPVVESAAAFALSLPRMRCAR